MILDEIISAQKLGEAKGITSICSANPWILQAAMQRKTDVLLIEATCNQVNQFGGYTGMTPASFIHYVREISEQNQFPFENIILGGDHLGPNVWQNEHAQSAMQKSAVMMKDYVQAGFVKIHLDCSMRLRDDLQGVLSPEISARRAAQLAKIAESFSEDRYPQPRYIIGTEVPVPGGAHEHEDGVSVTRVEDARNTIEITREAFYREGLQAAWERVIGVVVQPGVEFGDDFVLEYQPEKARDLSRFIESQAMVYEAHSTDYQTRTALKNLVRDHFAILKVGPGLTFAFREAIFALAMIEKELFPIEEQSNLTQILDAEMLRSPEYWKKYYPGTPNEQAFKRKYSMSDRLRYYWPQSEVQSALNCLLSNLSQHPLPPVLLSQYMPKQYDHVREGLLAVTPTELIQDKVRCVLNDYDYATGDHWIDFL